MPPIGGRLFKQPNPQIQPLRRSTRTPAPRQIYVRDSGLFSVSENFVKDNTLAFCYHSVVEFDEGEPSTLKQALSCQEHQFWHEAIQQEVFLLLNHNVWHSEPVTRTYMKNRFIFKKKPYRSKVSIQLILLI